MSEGSLTSRRVRFWAGVACVSVLSNFALEVVAHRVPQLGLAKFTAFTHKGAS
jgi:hypothetical protein